MNGVALRSDLADDAPHDEAGVAHAIHEARAARTPLAVHGNGTKLGMLRPVQAARSLSTRRLTGITLYSPAELIISARAGTPVAEIEAALAQKGQFLVAEPPDLAAVLGSRGDGTIGGAVATNMSGPRRVAWGAMRDHLMGIRAVNGAGEVFHSGGRVLKNVTGLDLCKLLAGSHGTLGVMTEITLKVLPRPEQAGTLVLRGLDATRAVAALSAALGSPYGVSGAAWLPADAASCVPALAGGGSAALIRIEDFAASVAYRTGKLAVELVPFGEATLLDDDVGRTVWQAVRDAGPLPVHAGDAVWRVSVRPSSGPGVLAASGARGFLDWGGGLVWLAGDPALHDAVTASVRKAGGVWTLMRGPETMRAAVDAVPAEQPALAALSRRVKAVMDPDGILNPGRITAGA